MTEADSEVTDILINYSREYSYQRSFCIRSCVVRPMPKGIKVYLVLLQFVLYEIASYSTELYLSNRFSPFLISQRYRKQYMDTDDKEVPEEVPSIFLALRSLHLIFCLPMGFFADKYYGRTKVLVYSWILVFVIECIFTMHVTLFEVYISEYLNNSCYIALTVVIIALHAAGLAGVHVNLISYGVDQLVGAFADELSSYFHWYYWCRSAGVFIVCTCGTYILVTFNSGYVLLIATVSCGVAVVTNLLGTGWFFRAEKVGNPLLLIYRVLRYATTAKPPGQRSAFSYDDRPEPSRIDLVKETHHGYIKDEKVEDVKIFLRILGILFSLLGFFCVSFLLYSVYLKQAMHLKFLVVEHFVHRKTFNCNSTASSHMINTMTVTTLHISSQWCLGISTLVIIILIPILDRLFYPTVFCQWVATMFNRITLGMCFSMLSILCALALEVWRHVSEGETVTEVNTLKEFSDPSVGDNATLYYVASDISVFIIIPQFVFQGIAEAFSLVTVVEFIYAQSPGYMKGLLMGCLFFTEGFAVLIGALLFVVLAFLDSNLFRTFNSCYLEDPCDCYDNKQYNGFAIGLYSVVVVIGLISFVTFRCAVRRYKVRKRDKDLVYFTNVQ